MPTIRNEDLHGAWALTRWRIIGPDGAESFPFSERATGQIIYSPEGRMAVLLMHPDWPQGQPGGFSAYGGRFQVQGDTVRHLIEYANSPSLIGSDQVRTVILDGDTVRLVSPAAGLEGAHHNVEWRRLR